MKRILIDTNVFYQIANIDNDKKLSPNAIRVLEQNEVVYSVLSIFELLNNPIMNVHFDDAIRRLREHSKLVTALLTEEQSLFISSDDLLTHVYPSADNHASLHKSLARYVILKMASYCAFCLNESTSAYLVDFYLRGRDSGAVKHANDAIAIYVSRFGEIERLLEDYFRKELAELMNSGRFTEKYIKKLFRNTGINLQYHFLEPMAFGGDGAAMPCGPLPEQLLIACAERPICQRDLYGDSGLREIAIKQAFARRPASSNIPALKEEVCREVYEEALLGILNHGAFGPPGHELAKRYCVNFLISSATGDYCFRSNDILDLLIADTILESTFRKNANSKPIDAILTYDGRLTSMIQKCDSLRDIELIQ